MVFSIYGLYDDKDTLRYIGMTTFPLEKRLKEHLNKSLQKKPTNHRICWIKSLAKRGIIPTIKLIDTLDSYEEMCKAEIFWINYYRELGADLVNTCSGGKGSNGYKWDDRMYDNLSMKVKQYSLDGTLIKIHRSISDAAQEVAKDRKLNGKLTQCCKGKSGRRTAYGFVWRYLQDSFHSHPVEKQHNITDAQRKSLSERQTLNNCMKGKIGILNPKSKKVSQYSIDMNFIATYNSVTEALNATQINNIAFAARTGLVRGGYYWKYVNEDIVRSSEKSENSIVYS
jgi:hypothetical protein